MRLVVIFEDSPDMLAVRHRLELVHLAFLEQHRNEIPMAGGLRNEVGGAYVGGLWMFDVSTRQRAIELIETDPYWVACPRKYQLLVWGKALPQFMVTV